MGNIILEAKCRNVNKQSSLTQTRLDIPVETDEQEEQLGSIKDPYMVLRTGSDATLDHNIKPGKKYRVTIEEIEE